MSTSTCEVPKPSSSTTKSDSGAAPAASGEKPALRICCACPETRAPRDNCIVIKGEESCKSEIEAHKVTMDRSASKHIVQAVTRPPLSRLSARPSNALVSSNHIALERDGSAASTMIDPSRTAVTRETSTTLVNASSSSTAVSGVTGTLSFESVRNRFHSIMEREQLSKDSVEYSTKVLDRDEQALADLKNDLVEAESITSRLKKSQSLNDARITRLRERFGALNSEISESKDRVTTDEKRLSSMSTALDQFVAAGEVREEHRLRTAKRIQVLQDDLDNARRQGEELRLRVADETKQLQQSTSRRDRVMEDICVLEQNKAALDRKIADLTASLSTTEVTLAQLEAQLAELERTRSAKEAEVQNRAGVIATIKARIASRKSDQETMSKFVEQRDVINKAIQEAEQEMARCTSESDAMRQRIDSMKTQRKTMEKETIEVEAKLNEVEKTIEQVESELGSLPSEETLTSQVAAAQSRIDALSAQTGQTSADSVSVLLCKLEALSEEVTAVGDQGMKDIATQMEKLTVLPKECKGDVRQKINSHTDRIKAKLVETLEAKKAELKDAQAASSAIKATLSATPLDKAVADLTRAETAKRAEVRAQEQQLETRTRDLAEVNARLEEARDALQSRMDKEAAMVEFHKKLEAQSAAQAKELDNLGTVLRDKSAALIDLKAKTQARLAEVDAAEKAALARKVVEAKIRTPVSKPAAPVAAASSSTTPLVSSSSAVSTAAARTPVTSFAAPMSMRRHDRPAMSAASASVSATGSASASATHVPSTPLARKRPSSASVIPPSSETMASSARASTAAPAPSHEKTLLRAPQSTVSADASGSGNGGTKAAGDTLAAKSAKDMAFSTMNKKKAMAAPASKQKAEQFSRSQIYDMDKGGNNNDAEDTYDFMSQPDAGLEHAPSQENSQSFANSQQEQQEQRALENLARSPLLQVSSKTKLSYSKQSTSTMASSSASLPSAKNQRASIVQTPVKTQQIHKTPAPASTSSSSSSKSPVRTPLHQHTITPLQPLQRGGANSRMGPPSKGSNHNNNNAKSRLNVVGSSGSKMPAATSSSAANDGDDLDIFDFFTS